MLSKDKIFGYWEEFAHKQSLVIAPRVSLKEFLDKGEQLQDFDDVLTFLKNGKVLSSSRGVDPDFVNPSKMVLGGESDFTDGTWLWTKEVIYYFENYNLYIPQEFLNHIRKNNYKVPSFSYEEVCDLCNQSIALTSAY